MGFKVGGENGQSIASRDLSFHESISMSSLADNQVHTSFPLKLAI